MSVNADVLVVCTRVTNHRDKTESNQSNHNYIFDSDQRLQLQGNCDFYRFLGLQLAVQFMTLCLVQRRTLLVLNVICTVARDVS